MVITNTWFLETLDMRNFKNGMVEIIKMGTILNLQLFEPLEKDSDGNLLKISNLMQNKNLLFKIMKMSIKTKANFIQVQIETPFLVLHHYTFLIQY